MSCFFKHLSLAMVFFIVSGELSAGYSEWIQVTGKARMLEGQYPQVKDQAMKSALQQAQAEGLQLSGRAILGKSYVQNEFQKNGFLLVEMNVEIQRQALCEVTQSKNYKKQLAILGFSLQTPQQTNIGGVVGVERGLASRLGQKLREQGGLVVYEQSQVSLHADLRNAPSRYTDQLTLTQAADFAKQVGVQFVVSGVVKDMGLEDEKALATDYWTKLKKMSGQTNQNRRFTVDLFVHEGFSGALVWQQQFTTLGRWQAEVNAKLGFEFPGFWKEEYGLKVDRLIDSMTLEIAEQLECQPFMTRISRVEGNTLHFAAGARSGIRPGDVMALYRTSNFYDANRLAGVDLQNVKTALTVSQVHPNFASGSIAVDPGRLNIQEDDLLVVW